MNEVTEKIQELKISLPEYSHEIDVVCNFLRKCKTISECQEKLNEFITSGKIKFEAGIGFVIFPVCINLPDQLTNSLKNYL